MESAEGNDDEVRREIVLHPRTAAARRVDRSRTFGSHVRGYTVQTDEVFALVQAQRRASLGHLAVLVTPILLLLVSLVTAPRLTDWTIAGVPGPWILLGPTSLFSVVIVAWRHDQRALQIERDWSAEHPTT